MSKTELTPEQRAVVEHSGSDLLVSAGAGSGKTYVLTQRVIRMVTDKNRPVDIDRLLIVTFTKAAAAEMRERISDELKLLSDADPADTNLRRQMALLPGVHISTIDSFCSQLVHEHFQAMDLDPDFRIISEGEKKLLRRDVFDELTEEYYKKGDEGFIAFMDAFTNGKSDDAIFDLVSSLIEKIYTKEDPGAFLAELAEKSRRVYSDPDDLRILGDPVREFAGIAKEAIPIVESWQERLIGGLFEKTSEPDILRWSQFAELDSYSAFLDLVDLLPGTVFERKSRISKNVTPDPLIDGAYEQIRNEMKSWFSKRIKEKIYVGDRAALLLRVNQAIGMLHHFALFIAEYCKRYSDAKRERNVAEFFDVEQLALQILSNDADAADSMRSAFDEIIVDEYQDSNGLQEAILSRITNGSNMFMVGDVKQSIYGFRNADPSLFTGKYRRFKSDPSAGKVIDLTDNFRCRRQVIDSVNDVFDRLMTARTGGVDYMHEARLSAGAKYPKPEGNADPYRSEYIILESDGNSDDRTVLEARMIAKRIHELMDPSSGLRVRKDRNSDELRPLRYSDIVLLFRSMKTVGQNVLEILKNMGIDAVVTKSSSYFDAPEVNLVLDYLKIIDNPRQDIPLAAVLLSPMGGFTADELASMRSADSCTELYDSLKSSADPRAAVFLDRLRSYRESVTHISIYELIDHIINDSCFDYYIGSLEGGAVRSINLDMLKEMARDFESSSYSSIFDFNRFIELSKKYEVGQDEGSSLSEDENVVRLMTIHSSKGLEFPVVFICDTGRAFRDDNAQIVVDKEMGLISDCIDRERSLRIKLPLLEAAKLKRRDRMVEEELRLLYVAMTRAKEKLIVTASNSADMSAFADNMDGPLPFALIMNAKRQSSFIDLALGSSPAHWEVSRVSKEELDEYAAADELSAAIDRSLIENIPAGRIYDREIADMLRGRFYGRYFNEAASGVKAGYSVSELKKLSEVRSSEMTDDMERLDETVPGGTRRRGYDPELGALIGTGYHLIFEKLDPARASDAGYVGSLKDSFTAAGLIPAEAAAHIRTDSISAFYCQDVGRRAAAAAAAGTMWRERPFVLGIAASDIDRSCTDDEPVVIQGIIDMYFTEGDRLVLIDYKSDSISDGEESVLIGRYQTQLEYYSRALKAAAGRRPDEVYIYSVRLCRFINVPI